MVYLLRGGDPGGQGPLLLADMALAGATAAAAVVSFALMGYGVAGARVKGTASEASVVASARVFAWQRPMLCCLARAT